MHHNRHLYFETKSLKRSNSAQLFNHASLSHFGGLLATMPDTIEFFGLRFQRWFEHNTLLIGGGECIVIVVCSEIPNTTAYQ